MSWIGLSIILLFLVPQSAGAIADKREHVQGFVFAQLTDTQANDWLPRASGSGTVAPGRKLVVWVGAYQLSTATSTSKNDLEVFLWDGSSVEQVTDNDADATRPVVNNLGEIAFQTGSQEFGNGSDADIVVRSNNGCWRAIKDNQLIGDRYPDINDNGIVVWGRHNDSTARWTFAGYDIRTRRLLLLPSLSTYRPHINAANHVESEANWLRLPDAELITLGPRPADHGYDYFRRAELNDFDWMIIEADPNPPSQHAHDEGPRDMLFWDGVNMQLIYRSPIEWVGRGDLNRKGVLAFQGAGGLPGTTSGTADQEIFVYDPVVGRVEQITDDDRLDEWPTVLEDDTIVWNGAGNYAGAMSGAVDTEIFVACPDRDGDGKADLTSYCDTPPGSRQIQAEWFVSPKARSCPPRTLTATGCGLGVELAAILPILLWIRRHRLRAPRGVARLHPANPPGHLVRETEGNGPPDLACR